jgi:hypothetical protein
VKAPFHPKGGSLKQTRPRVVPPRIESRLTGRTFSLSALLLFALFVVTAYSGANVIAFERLENQVGGRSRQPIEMLGALLSWENMTGVAARARNLALNIVKANTPGDTAAVENALDEVVKASPTSVAAWQTRAAYQRALGVPMERVLPGFRMSVLTGSHEGYYMMQRVAFGLDYWTELPEEDRHAVIRDLVGSASEYGPDRYRDIVAGKSQGERDEIRAAIMASGRGSKALLQALGI